MAFFSPCCSSFLTLPTTTTNTSSSSSLSPRLKCFTPKTNHPINKCFSFSSTPTSHSNHPSPSSFVKLEHIVTEFQSLPEPIDRVKRLLHYATLLPSGFTQRNRVSSNRVTGCTVEVWLDVSMDEFGRMRFLADSDSEIMKGFCSCLIWLLDGEFPEAVFNLRIEDLEVLNINGSYGRANSRVNTWNNVLINMKKRTQLLVQTEPLSSLCLLQS